MLILPPPQLHRPPWAGSRLAAWGRGAGEPIGESWEAGPAPAYPRLPLVKLIDVAGPLSVQVHPDDAQAARLEGLGACGKAESWVILEADPGARVALGLKRSLSAEELRARAISGEIEADLAWHPVVPGSLIDVPPGTIHTIGAGVLLYEVQQPSNLTYRLYDWGRPRPLHLAQAVEVAIPGPIRWEGRRWSTSPTPWAREPLFRTPFYRLDRLWIAGEVWENIPPQNPEAWTVIEGEITVAVAGEERRLVRGQTAILAGEVRASGAGTILAA